MQNGQQEIGWQWVNVGNGPMTIRNVYSKGPINVIVSSTAPPQGERGVPGPLGAMVDMGGAPLEVWSSHTVWIQACNTEPATVDVLLGSPASSSSAGPIEVSNFPATQAVSVASLPLPAGAAQDGTDATGVTAPVGGTGVRGWLSGIYQQLLVLVGIQGPTSSLVDNSSTPGYTYICKALPGAAVTDQKWQICRIDSTGSKLWAGGSAAFDKIAANRAGYSYS